MKKNIPIDFTSVTLFCSSLQEKGFGLWEDSIGKYRLSIDSIDYLKMLRSGDYYYIFSDGVGELLSITNDDYKTDLPTGVVSIGTFKAHNEAKLFCFGKNYHLITIPAPLSNDSFGTNRVQIYKNQPSVMGIFPSETIIDCNLIEQFPFSSKILGLGEFIGLYFSIIDYYLTRNQEIPVDVIGYILQMYKNITLNIDCGNHFCRELGIALVYKCLIMRKNMDHQIGCGIDHLLGGYLSAKLQIPHGHAIFLGCVVSSLLFPDWQDFGLTIDELISLGKSNGWLSNKIIEKLKGIKTEQLLLEAQVLRPDRLSILSTILRPKTGELWEQLSSLINATIHS